jgi:hypothetical protein
MRSSHLRHPTLRVVAAGTVMCGAAALGVVTPASAATHVANNNAGFVVVYDNNIENIETPTESGCPGNWYDLLTYMQAQTYAPDIFLMQQVSDSSQASQIATTLRVDFGLAYDYVIAKNQPATQNSTCDESVSGSIIPEKATQTNAIFYRHDRFTIADGGADLARWWSLAKDNNGNCSDSTQDRAYNVKVRLHDTINGHDITVASQHWPTANAGGGTACSDENIAKTLNQMTAGNFGGALRVFGGDFNINDLQADNTTKRTWFATATTDYKDAINSYCNGSNSCQLSNWTGSGSKQRIDMIMAQAYNNGASKPQMTNQHTVTFDEARSASHDLTSNDYSVHRAVRTYIYYP